VRVDDDSVNLDRHTESMRPHTKMGPWPDSHSSAADRVVAAAETLGAAAHPSGVVEQYEAASRGSRLKLTRRADQTPVQSESA
jgi:hypothetical protein